MKIKGAYKTNKVVNGRSFKKGDAIEYDPQEKPAVIVKDAVSRNAKSGFNAWADNVVVTKLHYTPNAVATNNKGFQSNTYIADGTLMLHELEQKTDRYFRRGVKKFHIEFEDCLDEVGMPELKTTVFNLE